jgi:hypothetical protein
MLFAATVDVDVCGEQLYEETSPSSISSLPRILQLAPPLSSIVVAVAAAATVALYHLPLEQQ